MLRYQFACLSWIGLFVFSSSCMANLSLSMTPLVRNQYRVCYIRDQVWGGVSAVACESKAWARYIQQLQAFHALRFACHMMGRDVGTGYTCCPFGMVQIGCTFNLPCRCVMPKKRDVLYSMDRMD